MSDRPLAEYVNDVASWASKHFHEGASTVAILDHAVEACRENDAMREALRRLGDLADELVVAGAPGRLIRAAREARDLYAPKESGQ